MPKQRVPRKTRTRNISQAKSYTLEAFGEKNAEIQRAQAQLRNYLDRAQYAEARELFSEMVKTTKYPLEIMWKVGVEIISQTTPDDLTDYLKAVYVGSSEKLAPITFNAYIDQLMINENWDLAFEEMELLYYRHVFHHPIILRKMAISAYNQWKAAKEKLPETYFWEEEHDAYDFSINRYEKYARSASKYLAEAHEVYKLDVVLLDMYLTFLDTVKDRNKKEVISITLQAFKENPEHFMLSYLLKINQDDQYFKSKSFILYKYKCDPKLPPCKKLRRYIERTCKRIKLLKKQENPNTIELHKYESRAQRICRVFVAQLENNNAEIRFIKSIRKNLFKRAISQEICEMYQSSTAGRLMKCSSDKKIRDLAIAINQKIGNFMNYGIEDEGRDEEIKEEGEEEDIKEEGVALGEDVINIDDDYEQTESEEDHIPKHTEISLFQNFLKHPLFND